MSLTRLLVTVSLLALTFSQTFGTTESRTAQCAGPGDQLTFECSVIGGAVTVWHGNAFDCIQNHPPNEIYFSHGRFFTGLVTRGSCNNGSILARTVRVDNNNHFISQVNVTVSSDMHNKTIECDREESNGTRVTLSVFRIILITEDIQGSPLVRNVHLASISQGGVLTFEWLDASSMVYHYPTDYIILSNCGTCPLFMITSNTSVTCQADVRGQSQVCQFAVLTQVCGRMYGNTTSQFLSVTLRVPEAPQLYVENNGTTVFSTIFYNMSQLFNISDGIDGSPISYTIIYSDTTTGAICLEATLPASDLECEGGVCRHMLSYGSLLECSPQCTVRISTYATNILGDGPVSDPVDISISPRPSAATNSSHSGLVIAVAVLSVVLAAYTVVTVMVCTVIIVKIKQKEKAASGRDVQRNQETGAAAVTYEEIGEVQQSSGRIDTTKNVAYCHVKELKSSK